MISGKEVMRVAAEWYSAEGPYRFMYRMLPISAKRRGSSQKQQQQQEEQQQHQQHQQQQQQQQEQAPAAALAAAAAGDPAATIAADAAASRAVEPHLPCISIADLHKELGGGVGCGGGGDEGSAEGQKSDASESSRWNVTFKVSPETGCTYLRVFSVAHGDDGRLKVLGWAEDPNHPDTVDSSGSSSSDDEFTLEEEERLAGASREQNPHEIADLMADAEVPIEELLARHGHSHKRAHDEDEDAHAETKRPRDDNDEGSGSSSGSGSEEEESSEDGDWVPPSEKVATAADGDVAFERIIRVPKINIGPEYEAELPLVEGPETYVPSHLMGDADRRWAPTDKHIDEELEKARQQIQEQHAKPSKVYESLLHTVYTHDYDVKAALSDFVPPVLPDFTAEERLHFESGLLQYGKNFFNIQANKLPHLDVRRVVEYYYTWKRSPHYDTWVANGGGYLGKIRPKHTFEAGQDMPVSYERPQDDEASFETSASGTPNGSSSSSSSSSSPSSPSSPSRDLEGDQEQGQDEGQDERQAGGQQDDGL